MKMKMKIKLSSISSSVKSCGFFTVDIVNPNHEKGVKNTRKTQRQNPTSSLQNLLNGAIVQNGCI